jgi:ribonuclease P protein component
VSAIVSKDHTNPSGPDGGTKVSRIARLLRHADFERVYKQGKRHFAKHMTVFYLQRAEGVGPSNGIRIGFTVGRALGGAVDRNRMKRRLREAVRLQESVPNISVDVVINPKKSLRTTEFTNLQNEVRRAFEVIEKHVATAAVAVNRALNK